MNSNPLKHFQNIEEEETLSNLFYKANITLIQKPEKHITKNPTYQYFLEI